MASTPLPSSATAHHLHVVYSGSVQFPVCIGSIAVPLALSSVGTSASPATLTTAAGRAPPAAARNREDSLRHPAAGGRRNFPITAVRYSHRRYCYVRDGGDLCEDAFSRWLLHATRESRAEGSEIARKRVRDSDVDADSGMSLPPTRSTSTLYSVLSHVEFVVPSSFARPRRVVREPPFFIVDDTWAEHMTEVHMHFLPALGIPPVVILHQVLLHRRVQAAPALSSHTMGQPKAPPIVLYNTGVNSSASMQQDGRESTADHMVTSQEPTLSSLRGRLSARGLVVSERQDMVRILHPSKSVQQYLQRVSAKVFSPVVNELRDYFLEEIAGERADSSGCSLAVYEKQLTTALEEGKDLQDVAPPSGTWWLPHEYSIYTETHGRRQRAEAALQVTLATLQEEQRKILTSLNQSMTALCEEAGQIREGLSVLHATCLRLRKD